MGKTKLGKKEFDRRAFMAGIAATAVVASACSGDDDTDENDIAAATTTTAAGAGGAPLPGGLPPGDVPSEETIFGWIEEVYGHGIRRPGYEADIWAEEWLAEQFRDLGMENVRLEPVELTRWEPKEWSLQVTNAAGETTEVECFPMPYTKPTEGLELDLVAFDGSNGAAVAGKASLWTETILQVPPEVFVGGGSAPEDTTGRVHDPEGTFAQRLHTLPFGSKLQEVMEPSMAAGAAAFVGIIKGYPGDSHQYFVPYDGIEREIPGVWISGSDGEWINQQLAIGAVRIKLVIDAVSEPFTSHNVVGELPGADDDVVMIGSHHDGPWPSAVEDGSGISLVLANATFWAAQPEDKRPHRMVFLLHGGHMCGGAGLKKYIEDHRPELANVVLQMHLEHAALDFEEQNGELVTTGECVPRWFFTSRIPQLEQSVSEALVSENLTRSMILAPDSIGSQPPTDGAFYYQEGVPLVHFLSAPFYLFDEMDRLDKVDRASLVPLTRWAISVVESTRGVSAADLRAAAV